MKRVRKGSYVETSVAPPPTRWQMRTYRWGGLLSPRTRAIVALSFSTTSSCSLLAFETNLSENTSREFVSIPLLMSRRRKAPAMDPELLEDDVDRFHSDRDRVLLGEEAEGASQLHYTVSRSRGHGVTRW